MIIDYPVITTAPKELGDYRDQQTDAREPTASGAEGTLKISDDQLRDSVEARS